MTGTKKGGLRTAAINKAKDPDYYKKLGSIGGKKSTGGGFKLMTPEQRQEYGAMGGRISRRSGPSKARLAELAQEAEQEQAEKLSRVRRSMQRIKAML